MSTTNFMFFGPMSKHKLPPWPICRIGGTLYSVARYVALWASCCFDPCALELTQLRDWEMLSITTAAYINHETLMIIYNYTFLDYILKKNA